MYKNYTKNKGNLYIENRIANTWIETENFLSSYPDIRRNNKVLVTQGINCERPAELAANTDFLGINKGINYNFDSSIQIIRRHKFR